MSAVAEVVDGLVRELLDMLSKGEAPFMADPRHGCDMRLRVSIDALDHIGAAELTRGQTAGDAFLSSAEPCQNKRLLRTVSLSILLVGLLRKSVMDLANRLHGARSSWSIGRPLAQWARRQSWRN